MRIPAPYLRYNGPQDRLILLGYLCAILGLLALAVGVFTLNLGLVVVAAALGVAATLLLRAGWKRLWKPKR